MKMAPPTISVNRESLKGNQDGLFTIESDYIDKKFEDMTEAKEAEAIKMAYASDNEDIQAYLNSV